MEKKGHHPFLPHELEIIHGNEKLPHSTRVPRRLVAAIEYLAHQGNLEGHHPIGEPWIPHEAETPGSRQITVFRSTPQE
jgi:hypothetical protein